MWSSAICFWRPAAAASSRVQDEDVLQIQNLRKVYKLRQGLGQSSDFAAVDDVCFSVKRGTTTAIVGESGSGKSTVAKMVLQPAEAH